MSQSTPADLNRAAQWMSNADLRTTARAVFSVVSLNPRNEAARMALVRELAQRGISPHTLGYRGAHVPLNPNPKKDPTLKKAVKTDRPSVDADKLSDSDLKVFQQAGWSGEPDDQREALYAPPDASPLETRSLSDAAVDMLLKQGWRGTNEDDLLHPPKTRAGKEQDRLDKDRKSALDRAIREAQTDAERKAAEQARAAYMAQGLAEEFSRLGRRK